MAFAYDGGNLTSLAGYTSALNYFEKAKTWRGDPDDAPRKLDGSKRHVTIRRLYDGSIACRLHRTDVVTFHPDNTVTVIPYGSRTTDEFFNRLMRSSYVNSYFTSGVIQVSGRFYRAIDTLKIDLAPAKPLMLTAPEPFKFLTFNVKRARAARDLYGYSDFSAYAGMSEKMGVTVVPPSERRWFARYGTTLDALKDRELWPHLLYGKGNSTWGGAPINAAQSLTNIREAIYRAHLDVYDTTEKPYLETWNEVERWKRQ